MHTRTDAETDRGKDADKDGQGDKKLGTETQPLAERKARHAPDEDTA